MADDCEEFGRLFVPPGTRHGTQRRDAKTATGWGTVHRPVTVADLVQHLQGRHAVGVSPAYRVHGGTWEAAFVALELDVLDEANPCGQEAYTAWQAVWQASEALGIPGAHWIGSYSGRRSLHLRLLPEHPLPLASAHAIARALRDGTEAQGTRVCTAYPSSGTGWGKLLRLPWGIHPFGRAGWFVDLGLLEVTPRPPYPGDRAYLDTLATNRVPDDIMRDAEGIARQHVASKRAPRVQRPKGSPSTVRDFGDIARVTRPCIAGLVRHGVPKDHRHNVSLLVRAELRHVGFSEDEALQVVLRYASACTPPWETADARDDVRLNWETTDATKRHLCPGRGAPSPLTQYLHRHACVGPQECTAYRAGPYVAAWGERLGSASERLYWVLCALEVGYALRPGDWLHTTVAELVARANVTTGAFKRARAELEGEGLIEHRVHGKGRGAGAHSTYRRVLPMRLPGAPLANATVADRSALVAQGQLTKV